MSVISIARDTNNNVSLVRMIVNDTLSAVSGTNYVSRNQSTINSLNGGTFAWYMSDMLIVAATDGNAIYQFSDDTFSTLNIYGGSGSSGMVYATTVATTGSNLNATYNNGSSGQGATLTNAGSLAALSIDSVSLSVGNTVLVKDQTDPVQNGIYIVTIAGSGAVEWVLTRADNYDTPEQIQPGDLVSILSGTLNANSSWIQYDVVTVIGTDPIQFNEFTANPNDFLKKANNLSDLNNNNTAVNNLQQPRGFFFQGTVGVSTITLTNPCPRTIILSPSAGNVTLVMPVMNSTTPGSKSIEAGEQIIIRNSSLDGSQVVVVLQDGTTPLGITNLFQDQWSILEVQSNSTANGTWQFQKLGTASYANASDETKLSVASLDNPSVAYNGKIPVYISDGNGTLGSSGVAPPSTNGQLIIGKTGDVPQLNTLTAGNNISITNGAGSITITGTESGSAFVTVAGLTQTMAPDTTYMNLSVGDTIFTLPATFPAGATTAVMGYGSSLGTFEIHTTTGQTILFETVQTTTGIGGIISSDDPIQYIKIKCMVANTLFQVIEYTGLNYQVL